MSPSSMVSATTHTFPAPESDRASGSASVTPGRRACTSASCATPKNWSTPPTPLQSKPAAPTKVNQQIAPTSPPATTPPTSQTSTVTGLSLYTRRGTPSARGLDAAYRRVWRPGTRAHDGRRHSGAAVHRPHVVRSAGGAPRGRSRGPLGSAARISYPEAAGPFTKSVNQPPRQSQRLQDQSADLVANPPSPRRRKRT